MQERAVEGWYYEDRNRNILPAVMLELAHALSRGRKPNSSSLLPGVNLREWLCEMFYKEHCHIHDDYGDPSTLVTALEESSVWTAYPGSNDMKIMRAIHLVRKKLLPFRRLPPDCRGDYNYQSRNRDTNLKKKRQHQAQKAGSWYDGDWSDYEPGYGASDFHRTEELEL